MDNFRNRNTVQMKKFNLSLKNRNHNNAPHNVNTKYKTTSDTSESRDSQDFKLRISDSSYINDSYEEAKAVKIDIRKREKPVKKNDDIIVISDSSDDEHSSVALTKGQTYRVQSSLITNNDNKRDSSINMESIEVSDEDDEIFTGSLTRKQSTESSESKSKSHSSLHYTSDDTNFELKFDDSESVIDSSYTTPVSRVKSNKTLMNSVTNTNISEKTVKPNGILTDINRKFGTPGSTKLSQCTTPLSKKDAKNIMKVIRSKRIESPVVPEKNYIIDETDSDSVVTDDEPQGKVIHPAWIDDSDTESSSVPKPCKTHVTRFLNPPDNPADSLSDEKQKEISRWILNNSPIDRSDDSISNISASNRTTSLSSGHRSLERLEVNYETPNNRQKFRETSDPKSTTNVQKPLFNSPRLTQPTTPNRQTLMDDYLKRTKSNSTPKTYIPIAIKSKTVVLSPAVDPPKAKLEDCADILDKLYGATWRQKTDILPTTEPRKQVQLQDRGVQTDCIRKPKKILSSSDKSSNDGSFRRLTKDMPLDVNSTKKVPKKYAYRDSFIVHSSESEDSTGDTTYMTALTNPRISSPKNLARRETPMSLNTRKAIEICDSDSDEASPIAKNMDNRRKLMFSDDDNDDSSATSEYDPDDIVPPKSVLPKTVRPLVTKSKIPTSTLPPKTKLPQFHRENPKSFMASLSASVPLENSHQGAKKYRLNYKNTKDELVKVLYKSFNDKVFENKLPPEMLIEWNVRMRGTAGFCYNKRTTSVTGLTRSSRIALATKILDKPDRLRDTLIHEMCHAAAWLINEVADGHGPFWKNWAMKAMRAFPELPPIKRCHDYEVHTKFTYRCLQCGYSIGRHSKSLDIVKKRCGLCYGRFELLLNRVTKSGTMKQIPRTPNVRQPSAFALYVKENYSAVKKQGKGRPHKEVMQLLGQQFSAIKLSKKNDNGRKSPEGSG